jgi:excinuclease ABC subunit C
MWSAARLPSTPGVYRFRDARGRVLYVGRAVDLRRRVASYRRDPRDRLRERIARVEAVSCDSAHEAAWLERNLLERSLPPWNRTPGGQEVPTYLRLDTGPAAPGLSTVHSATPYGPYLGGDRVRLAVAGLHRVLPLAYTGTGLTGTGRELAATRGVGPGDRSRLAEEVAAVLRREPGAVASARNALLAHRERAVAALAFERAGAVQAELDALDWIVSPQRVTGTRPYDADVAGWADGVLVRFEVRAGRLCAWTQRVCGPAGARRHLAASPPEWTNFAHRNAVLGARLVAGG